MDEDSQDEDDEKWPRSLNKLEKFAILESVKNSELSTEVRQCEDQFDACNIERAMINDLPRRRRVSHYLESFYVGFG